MEAVGHGLALPEPKLNIRIIREAKERSESKRSNESEEKKHKIENRIDSTLLQNSLALLRDNTELTRPV